MNMSNDLRLAARLLWQAKAWTVVVVASLALGIGANTALFSAVNGLLIRKLAVADPNTLVRFRHAGPNEMRTDVLVYGHAAPDARGRSVEATFSYPMYLQFVEDNRTLADLFACAPLGVVNVVANGRAETASAFVSSGNYFQLLGATTRLGRTIAPDDDRATATPVAVISHKYWMSRFGGDPKVVGSPALVNNVPVTIVGVLAPGFSGVEQAVSEAPDISLPLVLEPQVNLPRSILARSLLAQPNFWWLHVMGRLKPGVTVEQVQANFGTVFQRTARVQMEWFLSSLSAQEQSFISQRNRTDVPDLLVDSGSRGIYDMSGTDARAVAMLTAVVVLVLLIVCANVANLLLSRSATRYREMSVRLALGATRGRLVRQLLTESLLLATIGGSLGLVVARWGQQLLPGGVGEASVFDWRVVAFAVVITAITGLAFGIAPALRATEITLNPVLKESSRSVVGSRSLLGSSLVVAQVAISLVLLVGAGLFLRTLQNLRHVDVGFSPSNVLLFRVSPGLNRYDRQKQNALYDQIAERIRAVPGVRSVSWSDPGLMASRRFSTRIFIQGRNYSPDQRDTISQVLVSPTFFETMEIPLLAGRGILPSDTGNAPLVAVFNEAAARQFFNGEIPLGRRFGRVANESGAIEIVGLLRDASYNDVRNASVPTMYAPFRQARQPGATVQVRTAADPLASIAAIRDAVRQVDPNLPMINVTTQTAEIEQRFLQEKLFAEAYTIFGGLALFVASIGLFGLMSYSVARRTNEIGVRMALGAERQDVLRLVMRESVVLVVSGVAIGLAGVVAAGRLVSSLLFGLAPNDPQTIASAAAVMMAVAAVAGYLPAKRASRVDPMVALRYE
jgi:predicted permease